MSAGQPLNLDRIAALDARATPGPWRVVLDDTEGPTTVWQACTSPVHTEEVDPYGNTVFDCCADGGLHGEPFFTEADAAFVAAARTALPALVAEVRALRADLDASLGMHRDAINQAAALRAERDVLAGRLDGEAWERITRERDKLAAQLDAIRALHTDSPAGVCPSCARLAEAAQSEVDDGLVDYPCPTLRAMGIEDTPPLPNALAGYTVRPLPDPMPGFPCDNEACCRSTGPDTAEAIEADLRMVAATTGETYETVRELYDATGTRAADAPDGDR